MTTKSKSQKEEKVGLTLQLILFIDKKVAKAQVANKGLVHMLPTNDEHSILSPVLENPSHTESVESPIKTTKKRTKKELCKQKH